MTTSLYLCISADGLIATSNRISNEASEWSENAWEGWCSYCTKASNLIVGRKTYAELSRIDVSDILYPDHKIVISSRDLDPADKWVHFTTPAQAVDYLESLGIENILVGGGRQTGLAFVREGLIDEVVLDVQPVLFGGGTELLGELDRCVALEFVNSANLGNGALRNRYRLLQA